MWIGFEPDPSAVRFDNRSRGLRFLRTELPQIFAKHTDVLSNWMVHQREGELSMT